MGYLKLMAAGLGVAALMAAAPGAAVYGAAPKEAVVLTPEQERVNLDWGYVQDYIEHYKKAPDRVWMYPVQQAGMMRHTGDVLKWCDKFEERMGYKTGKVYPDVKSKEARLRDMLRITRVYVNAYAGMKEEIGKELPGKLEAAIKTADADTQKGAESGATADFDKGRKSLGKAEDIYVLAQAVYGAEDPVLKQVTEDVKGLRARVAERQKTYWEKSKGKMKRPEEGYKASDLEKIRGVVMEAWKEKYPNDKGVTVIVPINANSRMTVVSFNEKEQTIDLNDISLLPVRVVVESEGGAEWLYTAMVVKTGPSASPTISADVSVRDLLTSATDLIQKK
jgi:hypothetical protein